MGWAVCLSARNFGPRARRAAAIFTKETLDIWYDIRLPLVSVLRLVDDLCLKQYDIRKIWLLQDFVSIFLGIELCASSSFIQNTRKKELEVHMGRRAAVEEGREV